MDNQMSSFWSVQKIENEQINWIDDEVAIEYPLTIVVNGEEFATIVCSPSSLEELIIGFLASEGIIRHKQDIDSLNIDENRGFAYVQIHQNLQNLKENVSKRFIGSCCGKSRQFYFYNDVKTAKTVMKTISISYKQCFQLMEQLKEKSTLFKRTGGIHNGALCSKEKIIQSFSDIGRHNVLDKIYGYCIKNNVYLADKVIAFSGRISSEVLLKVSKMGCGILLSKSAPTNLALQLAEELNITTVGFMRGNKMNIYTHGERIEKG